jgi:transcriptional regulator with XRE-family HTH domain
MRDGDYMKRLAARLREARIAKGLSQEELAADAGLHRTHVSLIERNRRSVRVETLVRLARALDVEPASLLPTIRSSFNARSARTPSRQKRAR